MALNAQQKESIVTALCEIFGLQRHAVGSAQPMIDFLQLTKANQVAAVEARLTATKAALQAEYDALPGLVAPRQAALQAQIDELDDTMAQL